MEEIVFWAPDDDMEPRNVGSIIWDGTRLRAEPETSSGMQEILRQEHKLPGTGEVLSARKNPEKFFRNLPQQFSGDYLWASEPHKKGVAG